MKPGPVARVLMRVIRCYQRQISPYRLPTCRFVPTCSNYCLEALERKGAFKGILLCVWRVLRCNPFGKGGYDPVK